MLKSGELVLDFPDLFSVSWQGDEIHDFETRCDLSTSEMPKDNVLGTFCTGCQYGSLINSEQYRQWTNKKLIKIDRGQVVRS